jgi:hypothetical protein
MKKAQEEQEETVNEKEQETPASEQQSEQQAGGEGEGEDQQMIPEEYQQQAHKLIHGAPKHHLDHLRSRINAREDEIRKAEDEERMKKASKKGGKAVPSEYSTAGMPGY